MTQAHPIFDGGRLSIADSNPAASPVYAYGAEFAQISENARNTACLSGTRVFTRNLYTRDTHIRHHAIIFECDVTLTSSFKDTAFMLRLIARGCYSTSELVVKTKLSNIVTCSANCVT